MSRLTIPPNFIGTPSSDMIQATTTAFNDIGVQVNFNGLIDTLGGNDTVSGTATGDTGYGINDDGQITLGSGDDSIIGTGSFTGIQVSGEGNLDAGSGNDLITGIANSIGFTHNAYGLEFDGYLTGGSGDDLIRGEARGVVFGNVSIGLAGFGSLDGGNGNDFITGIGINENGYGIGIRNYEDIFSSRGNGSVSGGNGSDIITGYGTSVGIQGGIIDGGNGNDYFKARRIDSEGKKLSNQGGAIADVLITGGKGDDTFDVGYGNATLDGGQGFDTLILLGSSDNYSISGSNGELTLVRDGYTLNALNIENIVYAAEV
jgi:Ca2+-binding RTX toxin-like protein